MKIAMCGSMSFIDLILTMAKDLEELGHEVFVPKGVKNEDSKEKIANDYIRYYFEIILKSDGILVMNFAKNNVEGYIGGNTLMEMGFAHILGKRIFLFNSLPPISPYLDEIEAVQPIVINRDLAKLTEYNRELHKNTNAEFKNLSSSEIVKHRYGIDLAIENNKKMSKAIVEAGIILHYRKIELQRSCKHEKLDLQKPYAYVDAICSHCGKKKQRMRTIEDSYID